MPKNVSNILAPAGGLYKRRSYQEDPPFTTPDADNIWLDDTIDGRERVGSRAGFKTIATHGTNKIRCMASVRWLTDDEPAVRKHTIVAVAGTAIIYSGNDGATWTNASTTLNVDAPLNHGPLVACSLHQKVYIGDSKDEGDSQCKVFDPSTGHCVDIDQEDGFVSGHPPPMNCTIAVRYRDRLLLTGQNYVNSELNANAHQWYMSRSGNPADWDYTETDVLSAVAGHNAQAGELGEPIHAAIPHGDDCIIFGCSDSIWTLRSDPNFGGSLDNLTERTGIVGRNAWCRSSEGWLFMLTQDGVMAMPPGCGDAPRSISRERIPDDLLFVNAMDFSDKWVSMAYDSRYRGVHLWISDYTHKEDGAKHYWLDTKQVLTQDSGNVASFWPISVAESIDPFSALAYEGIGSDDLSDVILGGRAGGFRVFSTDEDTACEAESYVDIGPLSTTSRQGSYLNGRLEQINAVMANSSGTVTYEIRTGPSAEAAFDGPIIRSGTWSKQHSLVRPRVRDPYFVIRLKGAANTRWALENLTMVTEETGRVRYRD